jgi:hypothetical protein
LQLFADTSLGKAELLRKYKGNGTGNKNKVLERKRKEKA